MRPLLCFSRARLRSRLIRLGFPGSHITLGRGFVLLSLAFLLQRLITGYGPDRFLGSTLHVFHDAFDARLRSRLIGHDRLPSFPYGGFLAPPSGPLPDDLRHKQSVPGQDDANPVMASDEERLNWDFIREALDVIERHGYRASDNQHAGQAVGLIGDVARIYEGTLEAPRGGYVVVPSSLPTTSQSASSPGPDTMIVSAAEANILPATLNDAARIQARPGRDVRRLHRPALFQVPSPAALFDEFAHFLSSSSERTDLVSSSQESTNFWMPSSSRTSTRSSIRWRIRAKARHLGHPPHAPGGEAKVTDSDGNAILLAQEERSPGQSPVPEENAQDWFSILKQRP